MERLGRIWIGAGYAGAIFALFLFVSGAGAQELAGTWQGTLQGTDARLVVKIAGNDAAGWNGTLWDVDEDATGRALTSISLQGGTVMWAVAPVEVSYEGRLSADGNSINGTLKQGGRTFALNLVRATADTEWTMQHSKRMAKDEDPSFEVATIKPSDPKNGSSGFHSGNGRRINCDNETAAAIVQFAYGVHPKQIVGAPDWFFEQRWDVDGFPDAQGIPDYKQMQGMYRKLMRERFGLTMHEDTRTMGAYVLTVAKSGPKMTKSVDQEAMSDTTFTQWSSQRRVLRVTSTTMPEFISTMNFDMEKPIVDRTGLTGKWDFLLKWRPDTAPETTDANALPGLFTAIQEQAGLKLDSATVPVEVLVVDRVEKPGQN